MTPVEELRKAAALMRERAQSAEPGPWRAEVYDNGLAWVNTPGYNHAFPVHGFPEEAQHIASWHPQVALAIADWLEVEAKHHETLGPSVIGDCFPAALAVARTYLGGAP